MGATEGQHKVVKYLLAQQQADTGGGKLLLQRDRWGSTPLDDARRNEHEEVVKLLSREVQARTVLSDVPEDEELHPTQSIGSCDGETDDSSRCCAPLSETSSPSQQTATAIDLDIVGGSPRVVAQPKAASGLPATPGKTESQTVNVLVRGDSSLQISSHKKSTVKPRGSTDIRAGNAGRLSPAAASDAPMSDAVAFSA